MDLLKQITELSHAFGGDAHVKGGGGNTSCKTADTLWVKPSGTTLKDIEGDKFVAMDRAQLNKLNDLHPPDDPKAREAMVKEAMAAAVLPDQSGRPSVEAPLHNTLDATFVVHTHPPTVNGMTCAVDGKATCARLFPDALWMDYTDPGFTLCRAVATAVAEYKQQRGHEPAMIVLQNHGVFIGGATPDEIHTRFDAIFQTLEKAYADAGVDDQVPLGPLPDPERVRAVEKLIQEALPDDGLTCVEGGMPFDVAEGPITPDHIVYMKSAPFAGDLSVEALRAFKERRGYAPRILAQPDGTFGLGSNPRNAALAVELALDGAMIVRLAHAFGGIRYMDDRAARFIDNWEVESYRRKVAEQGA